MVARTHMLRAVALACVLLGTLLLLLAPFLPWYSSAIVAGPGGHESNVELLSPLGVQSTGSDGGPAFQLQENFSAAGLRHTGQLYVGALAIILAAGACAAIASALVFAQRKVRRRWAIVVVSLAAASLSVAGPAVLYVEQPPALCSEAGVGWSGPPPPAIYTAPQPNCGWFQPCGTDGCLTGSAGPPGQEATFAGSENFGPNETHVWGPTLGWYLPWVSAGLLTVGGSLTALPRRGAPNSPGK